MPQVPYSPVPNVSPTGTTPRVGVSTPESAFGGTVAGALQHFGATAEHVGDELFSRAIALQQLKTETEVNDASTKFITDGGVAQEQYQTRLGLDAADGLKDHIQSQQSLRDGIRSGLSSDYARKLFDRETLSTYRYFTVHSAGHAATETKKAALKSLEDSKDATTNGILTSSYDDPSQFQSALNSIDSKMASQARLMGWDAQTAANETFKARSKVISNYGENIARKDPWKATEFLEANRGNLHADDLERLDKLVKQSRNTIGARNISDAVNGGWPASWSQKVIDRTTGVQPPLLNIVKEATRNLEDQGIKVEVAPQGGTRSQAEQDALVAAGRSKTRNSNHLNGRAIDLVPLGPDGKPNFNDMASYAKIETAIKAASEKLGIPLGPEHDQIKSWDQGHFSLPREYDVASAPKQPEEPESSRVNRAEAYARQLAPDDSTFHDYVRQRTMSDFRQAKSIHMDEQWTAKQTVAAAMIDKPGAQLEELRSDPKVAGAWDVLDPTTQKQMLSQLNRQHAVQDDLNEYDRLKGMAEDDPLNFVNEDIINNDKLSRGTKRLFLNLQHEKKKNPERDPRVNHALSVINLPVDTLTDITQRQQYKGALQTQLEQYQQLHGKPMPDAEIKTTGYRLLQKIGRRSFLGFSFGGSRAFEAEVPSAEKEKIENEYRNKNNGEDPPEGLAQQIWAAQVYQDKYGSKQSSGSGSNRPLAL